MESLGSSHGHPVAGPGVGLAPALEAWPVLCLIAGPAPRRPGHPALAQPGPGVSSTAASGPLPPPGSWGATRDRGYGAAPRFDKPGLG